MDINPHISSAGSLNRPAPAKSSPSPKPTAPGASSATASKIAQQEILNKVNNLPGMRPEMLQLAKELVRDAHYPSPQDLDDLADSFTAPGNNKRIQSGA